jgi:hypothetical protein
MKSRLLGVMAGLVALFGVTAAAAAQVTSTTGGCCPFCK